MSKKLLPLVALALAAAACSSKPVVQTNSDIPLWAQRGSGKCLDIPEFQVSSKNLCGIGTADNIKSYSLGTETASTRARAEIGKVMESRMRSFNRAVEESLSKMGNVDEIQKVQSGVETVMKTTLAGVTIPIMYQDKATGRFFALAMIDNETFADAMRGLKESAGLSEAVRAEINKRADEVVNEWERAESR
jgi:hypothetical protein